MYRLYLWGNKLALITTIAILVLFSAGNVMAQSETAVTTQSETGYMQSYGWIGSVMPKCVLDDELRVGSPCLNLTVFMALAVNAGRYLFTIVGALALGAFVYGGFILILSEGKQDKIKKGADAMLAAGIGLLVAFGAYVLIRFLGTSLGLHSYYQLQQ